MTSWVKTALTSRWLQVAALLALIVAVYANVYHNAYQLDDSYRVRDNPHIRKVLPMSRFFEDPDTMATLPRLVQYRPLLPLSLAINRAISGPSLAGYHIGNVLLHAAVVVLVYLLLLELLTHWSRVRSVQDRAGPMAFFASAIFAIHPIAGIPVNYISARDLQLMAVFFLGFVLIWVRMQRRGNTVHGWVSALLLLFLSLLAKENGVAAPALMIAFSATCCGRSLRSRQTWLPAFGVAAFAGLYLAFVRIVVGFSGFANVVGRGQGGPLGYLWTQLKVHLFEYLPLVAWPLPVRQAPHVEPVVSWFDPAAIAGAVFLIGTLYLAWRLRQRQPLVAMAILSWWILLALTSSMIPMIAVSVHYRPYLSLVFASLLVAMALWHWLPARWLAPMAGLLLVLLAVASWRHNATWADDKLLFDHSVRYGGAPLAHLNLGVAWMGVDNRRARAHFEDALEMNPAYVLARLNLGITRVRLGDVDEGLALMEEAIRQDPKRAQSHHWYAVLLNEVGRTEHAALASATAAALRPDEIRYRYRAALDQQAVEDFEKSLDGWFNLGWAYFDLGRCEDAIYAFEQSLRLRPEHAETKAKIAECRLGH